MKLIRRTSIQGLMGLALLMAPWPVLAQSQNALSEQQAQDALDSIMNQPTVPMPEIPEGSLGNSTELQKLQQANAKGCSLWEQEKGNRTKELAVMPKQKVQHLDYINKQRIYLAGLARKRDEALAEVENYKARKLPQSQIDFAQHVADELVKKFKLEQEKLFKVQDNYQKIVARQAYYVNLDDYFPQCYDKYPETPDPDNIADYKRKIKAMKGGGSVDAATTALPNTARTPAVLTPADCATQAKAAREKELISLQQSISLAQTDLSRLEAALRKAEQSYAQGQQEYDRRKQSNQYSSADMEAAYKTLVGERQAAYNQEVESHKIAQDKVAQLNQSYDTLKSAPLPTCQ